MVRCGRPATASANLRQLIIRPGGIGDCILSLPAMQHLRADYTEVWVPSAIVPLIRFAPARSIASTGIDLLGLPEVEPPESLIAALRSFDSIVSWYGSNRAEFPDHVRALGLPFHFLDALPDAGVKVHAADFFLRQVGGSGQAVPKIDCGPVDYRRLRGDSSVFRKHAQELATRSISRTGRAVGCARSLVRGARRAARRRRSVRKFVCTWMLAGERAALHRQ